MIGALIWQFSAGEMTTRTLIRAILVLAGIVLSLLKLSSQRTPARKKQAYANAYKDLIGNAFAENPALEKKLYRAIDDYNSGKFSRGAKRLEAMYFNCENNAQRFAVKAFSGLCYGELKDYPNAISQYNAALNLRENSTVASNLGLCYTSVGDFRSAQECYLRAARADSGNPYPLNNLAQLLIKQGDYEAALPYALEAIQRKQDMPQALNAAAICYAMADNDEEYQRYFHRAVSAGSNPKTLKAYIEQLKI